MGERLTGVPCLRCRQCGLVTGFMEVPPPCSNCGTTLEEVEMKITNRLKAPMRKVMEQTPYNDGRLGVRLSCDHNTIVEASNVPPEDQVIVNLGCIDCARLIQRSHVRGDQNVGLPN